MKIADSRQGWGQARIGAGSARWLEHALCIAAVSLLVATAALGQSANKSQVGKDSKEDIKQAQQLADRGDKSFATGRWNEALAEYQQAVKHAPGDAGIARRAAALRAEVVQKLVDQAETAALDGFVVRATDLMYEALKIEPGNTIVAERLAQMKQMKEYLPRGDKEDYEMKGAAALRPQQGKKAINARGDSKSAYEQVAGMFGITVAFDPDLTSKNIKLHVNDVDFYTAMQLLGAESKTFYRVVNSTLIFVAEDTIAKRKEYAEEVEQTFRLDNTVAPEDVTEMVRVVRNHKLNAYYHGHREPQPDGAGKCGQGGAGRTADQGTGTIAPGRDAGYRAAGGGPKRGEDAGHNAAVEGAGIPVKYPSSGATGASHRHCEFVDIGSAGFFGAGNHRSSHGCFAGGWRKEHVFADHAERVRDIFERAVAGKKRAANPDAGAGWKGGDILCGAAISGDVVAVVHKPGRNDGRRRSFLDGVCTNGFRRWERPGGSCGSGLQQRCAAGPGGGEPSGQLHFHFAQQR